MKINIATFSLRRAFALAAAALSFATFGVSHAHAQGMLTLSGGTGKPLTLTLNAPVTYLITTASDSGIEFDFQGAGDPVVSMGQDGVTGTITYSINGGAAQKITKIGSGVGFNDVGPSDIVLLGGVPNVAVGDIVVINTGTVTMVDPASGPFAASGSFPTFAVDGGYHKLDAVNGVAGPTTVVPEPSTWALLGVGVAGLGIVTLRRRRVRAA